MTRLFLTFVTAFLIAITVKAQSYEQGMGKAFNLMKEGKFTEASSIFQLISKTEKDNWIPTYHAANTLIISSFNEKDIARRTLQLEEAKKLITEAHRRSGDNSEIYTLEGLLYTGYVTMDPQTFGMQYSGKIMGLHKEAIALNPENPRAHANLIEWEMGAAKFMGGDVNAICAKMSEIIPKFENQKLETPFAPSYGIERAKQVASNCNG